MPADSLRQRVCRRFGPLFRRLWRSRVIYFLRWPLRPISDRVGNDRGQPIDRYYIERFLDANRRFIAGRCLEVKDDDYTRRYGGAQVTASDVLDVNPDNPRATIRGDLRNLAGIADATYDCIILTQVLQYIDDQDRAIAECRRILKAGGSVLVTVPCLGKIDGQEDGVAGHYWRLTPDSARWLFLKQFRPENVEIHGWGNVAVGLAFWTGIAIEELPPRKRDYFDPAFVCGVTIRATKEATVQVRASG